YGAAVSAQISRVYRQAGGALLRSLRESRDPGAGLIARYSHYFCDWRSARRQHSVLRTGRNRLVHRSWTRKAKSAIQALLVKLFYVRCRSELNMRETPDSVVCRFYRLIPDAPVPRPADRSADGTLPVNAYRYCEAIASASAFGWYMYPPLSFSLWWDG